MARCVLTVEDGKEPGEVKIQLESDPPFPGPAEEDPEKRKLTPAQAVSLDVLSRLCKEGGKG